MVNFERHRLSNGLTILVQEDFSTPLAAVNILYPVGARNESPEQTGFAHLFEHFMFEGSVHVPDFDTELQLAGGENNAFTTSDITNYYDILPAANLETAFWLESDRMLSLDFNEESLATQKRVVIEEFKENYVNQPYGDWWHAMSALAYQVHPYRWPVIGLNTEHIAGVKMEDFRAFFFRWYRPNQAILSVSGGVKANRVFQLAERWFGDIPRGENRPTDILREPEQREKRTLSMRGEVPVNALFKAWKMSGRNEPGYFAADIIRDLLSNGDSSRLYEELVKEQKLYSSISAYLSDTYDEGLLFVEGRLNEGISFEAAEEGLNHCVRKLAEKCIDEKELMKVKNKLEAYVLFGDTQVSHRAMNLGFYEWLGDANRINTEIEGYRSLTAEKVRQTAEQIFAEHRSSVIYYHRAESHQTA